MNILYLSADPGVSRSDESGAGRHVCMISEGFEKAGNTVLNIIEGDRFKKSRLMTGSRKTKPAAHHPIRRDLIRIRHDFRFYRSIQADVSAFQPDIIYERAMFLHLCGSRLAKQLDVPHVIEENSVMDWKNDGRGPALPVIARQREIKKLKRPDNVITVTRALKEYIVAMGVPEPHVHVIQNGVDLSLFEKIDDVDAPTTNNEIPTIGFVGAFREWHRLDLLLESTAALHKNGLRCRLLIVGGGEQEETVKQWAQSAGLTEQVELTGSVPFSRVPDLLRRMHIAVIPGTNAYGSPVKLFEYGAAALPVVAPDVPPVAEVIQHDRNGLLFTPGNKQALQAGLSRLIKNVELRRKLGDTLHRDIKQKHTWQANVDKTLEIMHECIDRNSNQKRR